MSTVVDFPSQGTIGTSRKPKRFDIDLYSGDTFAFYLTFGGTGLDVTGWTAISHVRKISDNTLVADIVTIDAVDTVEKSFLVHVDSDLLDPEIEYSYDIQVTDASGNKRTYIGGKITITEDITE